MALRLPSLEKETFERFPPPRAREIVKREAKIFGGVPIPVWSVEDRSIPGPGGDIVVRIYRDHPRTTTRPTPLVVSCRRLSSRRCAFCRSTTACDSRSQGRPKEPRKTLQ